MLNLNLVVVFFVALMVSANGSPIEQIDQHDTAICPPVLSNGCETHLLRSPLNDT